MAAVSHELRTPLTGILTISELLQNQMRGPLNAHQERYVQIIVDSGQRLLKTVNAVLQYTSLAAGAMRLKAERCHLAELCAYAVQAVEEKAKSRNQSIALDVTPADMEIISDAVALTKIVTLLLENAEKFTPDHGAIGIRVRPDAATVGVQIEVWDTGIGMSAEQVSHLFEPFVQGDQQLARQFEGLGLGLAYVHKAVALLGGEVTATSEPGKGSRFTVTLPAQSLAPKSVV